MQLGEEYARTSLSSRLLKPPNTYITLQDERGDTLGAFQEVGWGEDPDAGPPWGPAAIRRREQTVRRRTGAEQLLVGFPCSRMYN